MRDINSESKMIWGVRNAPSVGSLWGTNRITQSGGKFRTGAKEIQIWDSSTQIKGDTGMPHFIALHYMALHRCCAFLPKDCDSLHRGGLEPNLQHLQDVPVLFLHSCFRVSTTSNFSKRFVLLHWSSLSFPTTTYLTDLNFPGVCQINIQL